MRKRKKKIYLRLLVIAAMFIVVLYSPIGSPDLYHSGTNYSLVESNTIGIQAIANKTRSESVVAISVSPDKANIKPLTSIPGATKVLTNTNGYSVSHSLANTEGIVNSAVASIQNSSMSGTNSVKPNSAEQIFIPNISKSNISNLSSTSFYASKDLTSFETNNSLLGVDYTPNSGATDPGGEGLVGSPIPVPDGYGYLLFLGVFYFAIKRLKMI